MLADTDVWVTLPPLLETRADADREGLDGSCFGLLSLDAAKAFQSTLARCFAAPPEAEIGTAAGLGAIKVLKCALARVFVNQGILARTLTEVLAR